jgi:3-oxoacyl-[acyl-carrier protein] reductase
MTRDRIEANKKNLLEQIPLNRLGEPEELAPIIAMLTSDLAGYLTGVTVEISGGKCCVQNPLYGWEQYGPTRSGVPAS